jgi:1-acyl-sn-glycerol-3-phosphate acyltransferase
MEYLAYVPILGYGMWFFEFIFLKQKWVVDRERITRNLKKAARDPNPLLLWIFPEGTLNTPLNVEKSRNYAKKVCY